MPPLASSSKSRLARSGSELDALLPPNSFCSDSLHSFFCHVFATAVYSDIFMFVDVTKVPEKIGAVAVTEDARVLIR